MVWTIVQELGLQMFQMMRRPSSPDWPVQLILVNSIAEFRRTSTRQSGSGVIECEGVDSLAVAGKSREGLVLLCVQDQYRKPSTRFIR